MGVTQKQLDAMAKSNQESNFLTREAIKEALFLLLLDHSFGEIRITEIINRAGVSRSAFYHNYKSKEDILVEILRDSHDEINTHTSDVLQNNWEAIFANVKANEEKMRLLLDAGLEKYLLTSLNESPYFSTTDYSTALWNGLIFNAILFYAKSGFGDPIEAASSVQAAMQTMAEFVSAQHPK